MIIVQRARINRNFKYTREFLVQDIFIDDKFIKGLRIKM